VGIQIGLEVKMRKLFLSVVLMLAGCAEGDGGRWPPNTALNIAGVDGRSSFDAALAVVRQSGYEVVELDGARGYFRVRSRLDNDAQIAWGQVKLRVSFFSFQVSANGRVTITASGFHVRGDVMHHKLDTERRELAAAVGQAMRLNAPSGSTRPPADD
jgi:hypothetical protein